VEEGHGEERGLDEGEVKICLTDGSEPESSALMRIIGELCRLRSIDHPRADGLTSDLGDEGAQVLLVLEVLAYRGGIDTAPLDERFGGDTLRASFDHQLKPTLEKRSLRRIGSLCCGHPDRLTKLQHREFTLYSVTPPR
jgi:hypothetical protein